MTGVYQEYLRISGAKRLSHQKWRAKQSEKDREIRRAKSRLAMQRWRKRNKEKVNAARRLTYATNPKDRAKRIQRARDWINNNHANWLLRQVQFRAKKTGVKFNLTIDDIVVPKLCPVFGITLKRGKGQSCDNSPTVDRIQSDKGYVKGNIAIISRFANSLKGKASAAQHRRIADWIDEQVRK